MLLDSGLRRNDDKNINQLFLKLVSLLLAKLYLSCYESVCNTSFHFPSNEG